MALPLLESQQLHHNIYMAYVHHYTRRSAHVLQCKTSSKRLSQAGLTARVSEHARPQKHTAAKINMNAVLGSAGVQSSTISFILLASGAAALGELAKALDGELHLFETAA